MATTTMVTTTMAVMMTMGSFTEQDIVIRIIP
jgi:hypothetical protein